VSSLADVAARVMSLAQNGSPDEAALLARTSLAVPGAAHERTADLACLWYAVAVAEHVRGDTAAQVLAAELCLSVAGSIGSPGWASNALSMRAMARARQGSVEQAQTDLARAEVELADCTDDALRCWAHTGLGYCYDQLRLYELAQPHLENAIAIGSSPMPLVEAPVIDLRNLAELHLRWAEELERVVPLAATAEEVADQMAHARHWASEAVAAARALDLSDEHASAQRLDLCVRAGVEPASVLDGLTAALTSATADNHHSDRAQVATALARALRALGRGADAVAAARVAVEAASRPIDWQLRAGAHHLLLELEAEAGVPGAVEGREYGRLLSEVLWQQRLRTLQGARAAVDVERLQRTTEVANRAAREDALTGLGNRRALDEALALLGRTGGGSERGHTAVLIDLDDFKAVNDNYGHAVGDDVLRVVGRTLRSCARSSDLVVRLGGDEFVVLAADTTRVEAAALTTRLRHTFSGIDWDRIAPELRVQVSIGFAATADGVEVADLLQRADESMYADKRRGSIAPDDRRRLQSSRQVPAGSSARH
jgi:diguanylate cyclase (GGDEF)-like protein